MKVKRYIADNYQDALRMIKTEMGSDAIILQENSYKEKGLKGLFKKRKLKYWQRWKKIKLMKEIYSTKICMKLNLF